MGRLFGTDGVRGVAGTELTRELAQGLGRAAVVVLGRHGAGKARLVVGRDTRESGEWLEDALTEGIREAGGDVLLAGVEPTPAVAFMTVDLGASSGVVISASHNPAEDNGIKFFARDGMKLPDRLEDEIEAELARPMDPSIEPGEILPVGDARERYLRHLEGAAEARLDGMTVVVDCANGAASQMAPEVLRRLGAEVHAINAAPDGRNINDDCGALHPEVVAAEVVRIGADAGVCHDGDADRALFADAAGAVIRRTDQERIDQASLRVRRQPFVMQQEDQIGERRPLHQVEDVMSPNMNVRGSGVDDGGTPRFHTRVWIITPARRARRVLR
jgi:phosphoglucosamine mutase